MCDSGSRVTFVVMIKNFVGVSKETVVKNIFKLDIVKKEVVLLITKIE